MDQHACLRVHVQVGESNSPETGELNFDLHSGKSLVS